jgi:RNA polymerase sigma factor (sigma-70 family)
MTLVQTMPRLIPGTYSGVPSRERHDELQALADAVQAGSSAALETFVRALAPHLIRVTRRVLGSDGSDVEDVAQEAALAVLDALPRYRGEGTVLHFACRVAVLTAMNTRRKVIAQKRTHIPSLSPLSQVPSRAPGPDQVVANRFLVSVVRELLLTLPENQAEALALHAVLGCTVAEIAESTAAPEETVRSRLRLAKLALRKRVLANPILRDALENRS